MLTRREFVVAIGLAFLTGARAAGAQQATSVRRIAVLSLGAFEPRAVNVFRESLRDLGWIEGRNLVVEYRSADGKPDQLARIARELVALNPSCVLASSSAATVALKQATSTVPIVAVGVADPVAQGFVASLARPGRNITGPTNLSQGLMGKRFGLVMEIRPKLSRIAILRNAANPSHRSVWPEFESAAVTAGLQLVPVEYLSADDFEAAFDTMTRQRAEALFVMLDSLAFAQRKRIAGLAAKHRLPDMYGAAEYVEAGGLIAYGPSRLDIWRRSASYVDKILKGAKPGDLPVEQPTKFELVINMRTAKELGIAIPAPVMLQADRVIE